MSDNYSEITFTKDGIVIRTKTNFPLIGEEWVEKKLDYQKAFDGKKIKFVVTSISPKIENGVLKDLKFGITNFEEIASPIHISDNGSEEGIHRLSPIKMITNRNYVKPVVDGTKIRFDWKNETYETTVDSVKGVESSLYEVIKKNFKRPSGRPPSLNVYRDINAKYLINGAWRPLEDLKI